MRAVLCCVLAALITGCASTPPAEPPAEPPSGTRPAASPATPSKMSGNLSPRQLEPGECGLFVWTSTSKRNFILFSDYDRDFGAWADGDTEVPLTLDSASGPESYGQFPVQTFTAANGASLSLMLRDTEDLASGTRYKSGTLSITNADGWQKVVPVAALASCQTARPVL